MAAAVKDSLYNKNTVCPVCTKEIVVTKVKVNATRVVSRDTDMCVTYEGINPLFYEPWVCDNCGYAALADKFENISAKDRKLVLENITPRWVKRSFAGERDLEASIEAFKLVLLNLQIRNAKSSEFAKIALRLAWLYRRAGDPREKEFLGFAAQYYAETYEKERFPVDKLDEFTCMYMIGELNRRIGNYEEAVRWFSRLVASPDARRNPRLMESAREQFQLAKDSMAKNNQDKEEQQS